MPLLLWRSWVYFYIYEGRSESKERFAIQRYLLIKLDNKFKKKKKIVSVMNMLLIYLFASMKLEKGHKNTWL